MRTLLIYCILTGISTLVAFAVGITAADFIEKHFKVIQEALEIVVRG